MHCLGHYMWIVFPNSVKGSLKTLLKATLFWLVRTLIIIYNDCNDDNKYIKPEIQEMKPQRGKLQKEKHIKHLPSSTLFLKKSEKDFPDSLKFFS